MSAAVVILGSLIMGLIDVHKKSMKKRRENCRQMRQQQLMDKSFVVHPEDISSVSDQHNLAASGSALRLLERQNSFTDQDDILPPVSLLSHQRSFIYDDIIEMNNAEKMSIYSEDGILADMDLPDNIYYEYEDDDYLDENITSCNKVENYLMLSEYEQNLIKETEHGGPMVNGIRRMGRKWSLLRQPTLQTIHSEAEDVSTFSRDHETIAEDSMEDSSSTTKALNYLDPGVRNITDAVIEESSTAD